MEHQVVCESRDPAILLLQAVLQNFPAHQIQDSTDILEDNIERVLRLHATVSASQKCKPVSEVGA